MYLSATLIISILSLLVEATPTSRSGVVIPIIKRTRVRDANDVVDIARLERSVRHIIGFVFFTSESPLIIGVSRKIHHGFQVYQQNTVARHPSAPKVKRSEKRSIGSDPLIDWYSSYWYGSISVGTPAKTFTGELSLLTLYYLE